MFSPLSGTRTRDFDPKAVRRASPTFSYGGRNLPELGALWNRFCTATYLAISWCRCLCGWRALVSRWAMARCSSRLGECTGSSWTNTREWSVIACVAGGFMPVDAVNSVHGRHFEMVADGRLRASDKITVPGGGGGDGSLALSLPSATSSKWRPWTLFTASTETASYAS